VVVVVIAVSVVVVVVVVVLTGYASHISWYSSEATDGVRKVIIANGIHQNIDMDRVTTTHESTP